jgi:predicted membrane-bound spermidine synthase
VSRSIVACLFFISGFCGLLYQVIWTRLAFASFGIITPVLSVIISVFMLGLALGSWAGGRWIEPLTQKTRRSALFFYGQAELFIGLGAFAVPALFMFGNRLLLTSGEMGSVRYLFLSALMLSLAILPWCFLMGTTFPLMLSYIKGQGESVATTFSYLYVPNVLGAMTGTLLTAFLFVELLGFHATLRVAAVGNFLIAGAALFVAARSSNVHPHALDQSALCAARPTAASSEREIARMLDTPGQIIPWILFWTGFASLAMEVVWIRAFAPVVKTQVYSFALVLATYLAATFVGSVCYRRHSKQNAVQPTYRLLAGLSAVAFLPILLNDVRIVHPNDEAGMDAPSVAILLSSIIPLCALLGYLTPRLVDDYARGSPLRAGKAYAINVLGCILGPLVVSYFLLPRIAERHALLILGVPFFGLYIACRGPSPGLGRRAYEIASAVAFLAALFYTRDFEEFLRKREARFAVRRDYAASVVSYGDSGRERLLVNGIGMSVLTPITKFMAHLLAFHQAPPHSALIICFGMGTTYRSALSWGIQTTAVELVPGVRDAFGFYHADAAKCLSNPKGRIIIDDGRRFLMRAREKFDVIMIDPPPPVEAAGTSLLYSTEFYALAKQHLNPGGILQAWIPVNGGPTSQAAARSLHESFPYIRCFLSIERRGRHLLASSEPIPSRNAADLAAILPLKAKEDLMEWSTAPNPQAYLQSMLDREVPINALLNPNEAIRITDDQPYNEYFYLRGTK